MSHLFPGINAITVWDLQVRYWSMYCQAADMYDEKMSQQNA